MNDTVKNTDNDVIDLSLVFALLRKNLVLLIIFSIIGGIVAYFGTVYLIPEKYRATATVVVNNRSAEYNYITPNEITSSKNLAELYSIIIKSDNVLQQVIDDLELDISYEELKNSVSVQTISDTQVVEISMESTDPEYAKAVVAKFVEYSKPMIVEKIEAGSVKDLNESALSNNGDPVSPNRKKNTICGVVFGLILSIGLVVLKELLNTKIKSETDAVNALGVPLLGVIPTVDRKEFNK